MTARLAGATLQALAAAIGDETARVIAAMPGDALDALQRELLAARRVALHSAGRTGLVLRALTMRLFHLGIDAHMVGDVTAPPIAAGDLLLINASTGDLPSGLAHLESAHRAGARVAVITAVPSGQVAQFADLTLVIPAQTMRDDLGARPASILPMGSQYELVLFVLTEILVLKLVVARGLDFVDLRWRHANLL
jgi:6-phospho-3-hexuloisomerase